MATHDQSRSKSCPLPKCQLGVHQENGIPKIFKVISRKHISVNEKLIICRPALNVPVVVNYYIDTITPLQAKLVQVVEIQVGNNVSTIHYVVLLISAHAFS